MKIRLGLTGSVPWVGFLSLTVALGLLSFAGAEPQLSKVLRQSYSSQRLLESGLHSVYKVINELSGSCARDVRRFGEQLGAILNPNGSHRSRNQENETDVELWALQSKKTQLNSKRSFNFRRKENNRKCCIF